MANEIQIWNKFLSMVLEMPGVKIERESFIKNKLCQYCTQAQVEIALSISPLKVLSRQDIDRIANSVIKSHVKQVTTISAITGVPGGPAMFATVPTDIAQYYFHVFVLSQKLAYLYGYPDLLDENGNATDDTINLLTLFTGIMMGAAVANNAIRTISKKFAERQIKRLPQQALTKGVVYPIVKKIATLLGYKITKTSFAKAVGKIIPVIGGIVSGALTFATFRPGAKRLQKQLQGEMEFFYKNLDMNGTEVFDHADQNIYTPYEEESTPAHITNSDYFRILILISIAHVDNAITEKERKFITSKIEEVELPDDDKMDLINYLKEGRTPKFTFEIFKNENSKGIRLLTEAIELLKLDRRFTLGEKLYIKKIGKELGYTSEDIEEFMK